MDIASLYEHFLRCGTVCTDTRHILPGSIFFALKGEHFDGNAFAAMAIREGATLAVVSDPSLEGPEYFHVKDTLLALQALARHHRSRWTFPVIGITGSNGKTTTKELMHAALSTTYRTHATKGNLNNHIGVPLTLLSTPPDTEILICEMGANHVGEIAQLSSIARPTHGLITNIGQAHLEGFGSIEGVKKGKGELFDFLREHEGLAFINGNDPALRDLSDRLDKKVIYGLAPLDKANVCFEVSEAEAGPGFVLQDVHSPTRIQARLYGIYNAINMVAAMAVGRYFDVPEASLVAALAGFTSGANRSEVVSMHGATVIKDAYNANPSSMEASVRDFARQHPRGWIVAGDMKEMGDASLEAHVRLLELIRSFGFGQIFLVGPEFMRAVEAVSARDPRITAAADIEALAGKWKWPAGGTILLKGSRSMRLERLLEY